MLTSLSSPQWGKANPTGHFCGPGVKGDLNLRGTFDHIILWLRHFGEHLGWGAVGCGLHCGEESLSRPDRQLLPESHCRNRPMFERQCGPVAKGVGSESGLPRACHLLALETPTIYTTSLCLSFPIWKMGTALELL